MHALFQERRLRARVSSASTKLTISPAGRLSAAASLRDGGQAEGVAEVAWIRHAADWLDPLVFNLILQMDYVGDEAPSVTRVSENF